MSIKSKFPFKNIVVSLRPTSAFPIDRRTLFDDMDELKEAAMSACEVGSSDSEYYFGEILTYKSPDSTDAKVYKVINNAELSNILSIANLEQSQKEEIVEMTLNTPTIIKIGKDVETLKNVAKDSGLIYNDFTGLRVNLSPKSGLKLTNDGLSLKLDNSGNVKFTQTDDGLKGEMCWVESDF